MVSSAGALEAAGGLKGGAIESLFERLLREEQPIRVREHNDAGALGLAWFADGLREALCELGCEYGAHNGEPTRLVLNFTCLEEPASYRRSSQAVFVASVLQGPPEPEPLKAYYPYLIRTLSNALIYIATGSSGPETVHFLTPERGHAVIPAKGAGKELFRSVARRLMPIASSHLIIENEFYPDLPEELWQGDHHTAAFLEVGRRLDALNLLPAPFDLEALLPPADLRHVKRLYKLGGLSHGNMSERLDAERFWMSASGVDKSAMREVGRDILLVKGFSPERQSILLSVPPHVTPRRVSVDAIEHWMIYTEHPSVGAILHVHAWMDGVRSTDVAYPCGTLELAAAVAGLVREAEDPAACVVGLKNHGLTITGRSLLEILERVEGRLLPQVPME